MRIMNLTLLSRVLKNLINTSITWERKMMKFGQCTITSNPLFSMCSRMKSQGMRSSFLLTIKMLQKSSTRKSSTSSMLLLDMKCIRESEHTGIKMKTKFYKKWLIRIILILHWKTLLMKIRFWNLRRTFSSRLYTLKCWCSMIFIGILMCSCSWRKWTIFSRKSSLLMATL